ncbi:MAG: hypothetical protein IKP71_07360 [Candidatus Riflebacteria bacterium]|nr:hypothetical protein [Candidatus Riflebacteria bacterium]
MQKNIKLSLIGRKLFIGVLILCLCAVFYGCGSSGNIDDWADGSNVIRVSNLRGRVIAPINDNYSFRTSSDNEVCFSLLSTQGTRVFIEDNSNLWAIADANGNFVIPNVPQGKHRVIANVVSGTTAYRQRSDVVNVTGQYETQDMPYSIELYPALYSVKIHLSDLQTSSPVYGKVNIWGFTFDSVNGIVDAGPFPGGTLSKEMTITAVGYKDLKTLVNFGDDYKSELYIKMTPTTSHDSNQAPVVEINRVNNIVRTDEEIDLNGTGFDPEGDVITWKWSCDKGSIYSPNSQKTTFRTPSASGTVRITLTGTDSKGASGQAMLDINVQQGGGSGYNPNNQPPVAPNTPYPENLATGMDKEIELTWNCSDPNKDEITYTVNFGKQGSDLKAIATSLKEPSLIVKDLEANTKYFWQVTAYDEHYASTNSDIWQFETGDLDNNPPNTPTFPSPAHLEKDIDSHVTFSWSGGDPDGDPVIYKIYLATASTWVPSDPTNLTIIHTTNLLKYDYYGLARGAVYQWQIIATDKAGAQTAGPIWQFSTVEPENNIPTYASITEPQDGASEISVSQKLRWTAYDEDGDTLYYDVYFGTDPNPELVSASQPSQIYDPGTLLNATKYYWRVVVSDGRVANPRSDIWSFTTEEVTDEKPYVVSVTTPTSTTSPLRVTFSEYINNVKEAQAFKFVPDVSGTWNWSVGNTVAEFLPESGRWLPGSYNKFTLVSNVLEDSTGNLIETSLEKKFDVPSSVPVPTGYHSYAFPMDVAANTTVSIPVPDLEYGKNSYVVAVAGKGQGSPNSRASLNNSIFDANAFKDDPTYALRLQEAEMITEPIVVPGRNDSLRASVNAAVSIGQDREFYLSSIATSTSYPNNKVYTTLVKMSNNTLVYMDNAITDGNRDEAAENVLNVFDSKILQKVRNAFGNEPSTGIDGESRISIVLIKLPPSSTLAGYFTSADLYQRKNNNSSYRNSNEGKIIYIKYGMSDTTTFGTLAHEFQHMINYYQKNKSLNYNAEMIFENTWLNESLSKYSEEVCGYSILDGDKNTASLMKLSMENNNDLSLTEWPDPTINNYGQVYMFMHFFAQPGRYNSDPSVITRGLVSGNGSVLTGVDNVAAVTNEPFRETIAKWALSLVLNNYSSKSPTAYGIYNINLKGKYNGVTLPGYTIENVSSPVSLSGMPYENSVRFFRKASTGSGDTTITVTTGNKPVTLWLFDERE